RKKVGAEVRYEELLVPVFRAGRQVHEVPPLGESRRRTGEQLAMFHAGVKRFVNRHQYPVGLEKGLHDLKTRLVLEARGVRAAMVADGRVMGFVAKRFLAGDGIHYEPRWFKPWPTGVVAEVELDGVTYPLGDIYFNVGGVKVGFEICEDAWVAKRPGGALAL